jgi:hypothetical protein
MRFYIAQAFVATLLAPAYAQSVTQLFNFSSYVDIENSHVRPNGHLLLTTFDAGRLYDLDPLSSSPQAELVAALPGATALTGIAALGADQYAIAGGVRGNYSYTNETIYKVDMSGEPAGIEIVAQLPDAIMLNGMAPLPTTPHVVLAADSRQGCIFRVDTDSGEVDVAFADEATMTAPTDAAVPIGINGLKIANGHVYFTNTARGLFARAPISESGDPAGPVEVLAQSSASWDDFAVDESGVAFVAQANNALANVLPNGSLTTIVDDPILLGPTSVNLLSDGSGALVTTRGAAVDGVQHSGQVCQVASLPSSRSM